MSLVFDKAATLERMAFDPQLFREMIELMREDSPRRLHELREALSQRDPRRMHHAAHSLKGLAANFSASRTVQAASEIEKLVRGDPHDSRLPDAVQELQRALDELLAELAQHAAPHADVTAV
jgi:two-component system, sensor histidine kinase and response regulator